VESLTLTDAFSYLSDLQKRVAILESALAIQGAVQNEEAPFATPSVPRRFD